jgi:hypothetical protein
LLAVSAMLIAHGIFRASLGVSVVVLVVVLAIGYLAGVVHRNVSGAALPPAERPLSEPTHR